MRLPTRSQIGNPSEGDATCHKYRWCLKWVSRVQNKARQEIGFFSFGLHRQHQVEPEYTAAHFISFVFGEVSLVRPWPSFGQGCQYAKEHIEILKGNLMVESFSLQPTDMIKVSKHRLQPFLFLTQLVKLLQSFQGYNSVYPSTPSAKLHRAQIIQTQHG